MLPNTREKRAQGNIEGPNVPVHQKKESSRQHRNQYARIKKWTNTLVHFFAFSEGICNE
jgi:hypothetical protein